jgi:hypothetical protein
VLVPQQLEVEPLEVRGRLDPELLGQPATAVVVRLQRLGPPVGGPQRPDQLAAHPFPEGVAGQGPLQLRHQPVVPAGLDPVQPAAGGRQRQLGPLLDRVGLGLAEGGRQLPEGGPVELGPERPGPAPQRPRVVIEGPGPVTQVP